MTLEGDMIGFCNVMEERTLKDTPVLSPYPGQYVTPRKTHLQEKDVLKRS